MFNPVYLFGLAQQKKDRSKKKLPEVFRVFVAASPRRRVKVRKSFQVKF